MKSLFPVLAFAAAVGFSGASGAALIDRGNGMIYDTVLDITWLGNANLAATEAFGLTRSMNEFPTFGEIEIGSTGRMNWFTANAWIEAMNDANYLGYDDWRLPTVTPINGVAFQLFNISDYWTGSRDESHNVSAPGTAYAGSTASELAYMYYNNLGLNGYLDTSGAFQPDWGIFGNGTGGLGGMQNDIGLIENLQSSVYWFGTEYAPVPIGAWGFGADSGMQLLFDRGIEVYAWAVRPGDVAAAVPEPASVALVGLGLAVLGWVRRRRG